MWYILKYKKPIKATIEEYSKWINKNPKQKVVKQELINDCKISTVFLGLDHSWESDIPVLWETMIFGGKEDMYQDRYASYKEALIGHEKAVNLVKNE